MKTLDLFNLYMGKSHPGPPWSECKIGCLTVRLADDYAAKVSQLYRPPMQILSGTGLRHLPKRKGTWQATATMSWNGGKEKSILFSEVPDDGGQWDLCHLLTFLTGRPVATAEYREGFCFNGYGGRATDPVETLHATALAWQNRQCLVDKNLHIALLLYNAAMNADLLQSRAALYFTALNIILDQHKMTYQKVDKRTRKKLKGEISDILANTTELQPDQAERYKHLLHSQIDRGPSFSDKLSSLLQSLEIIDSPPTPDQKTRVQYVDRVRNVLMHTGLIPILKGLDNEQSENHTANIVAAIIPEIIRIVIGHHLGFKSGSMGSYCQVKDDVIDFFQNGVFRGQRFADLCEYVLEKNAELYQRLS